MKFKSNAQRKAVMSKYSYNSTSKESSKIPTSTSKYSKKLKPNYEKLAVNKFGITNNLDEAGYILNDGRLLDFSGRSQATGYTKINGMFKANEKDYLKGSRNIDHREIAKSVNTLSSNDWDKVTSFEKGTNALRYSKNSDNISISKLPNQKLTDNQYRQLKNPYIKGQTEYYVDIIDNKGNTINSLSTKNFITLKDFLNKN